MLTKPAVRDPGAAPETGHSPRPRPRIALYSHDTQGLGHVRRNLLLATAFDRMGCQPVILLLSGAREAGAFWIPPSVDCLTLPGFGKAADGTYLPRALGVPVSELATLRRSTLMATLTSFDPDILIVDKVPLGALDELEPALRMLKARGRAAVVLGLREVLDDPATVAREWAGGGYEAAIASFYDRIWVYGDPAVYDPAVEYNFSAAVREKIRYTGYLNPRDAAPEVLVCNGAAVPRVELPEGRAMLCEVGGGQDGVKLAEAFVDAELPKDSYGVLVTGPLMPEAARHAFKERAATRKDLLVFEFVTDCCALLARADRVVSMGGYNTVCEVLAYGKPALVAPRITPRTEQLIRAERMAALGLVDLLPPDQVGPEAISRWLAADKPAAGARGIDLGGVARLPKLLDEVLALTGRAGGSRRAVV